MTAYRKQQFKEWGTAAALSTVAVLVMLWAGQAKGEVIGGRPAGCPHAFCGCEASLFLFGHIIPDLNLAANWLRKFPHASPAPRMAAARRHHIMILLRHIAGNDWLVHDGNSGNHLTREHVRSIAGYRIVNPFGSRMAAQ